MGSTSYGDYSNVVGDDGSVHMDNAARDAGAAGGTAICAAYPATAAFAAACGYVGGEIGAWIYGTVNDLFTSHPIEWASQSLFPPDAGQRYTLALAYAMYGDSLGQIIPPLTNLPPLPSPNQPKPFKGNPKFIERLLQTRAMAGTTLMLCGDIAKKTGTTPGQVYELLVQRGLALPEGWSVLLRPTPSRSCGGNGCCTTVSVGTLIDNWFPPDQLKRYPYDTPGFWQTNGSRIDPKGAAPLPDAQYSAFTYWTATAHGGYAVSWDFIGNEDQFRAWVAPFKSRNCQTDFGSTQGVSLLYWEPKPLYDLLRSDDATFNGFLNAWATFLTSASDTLVRARKLPKASGGSSSAPVIIAGAGAAGLAALAWWLGWV